MRHPGKARVVGLYVFGNGEASKKLQRELQNLRRMSLINHKNTAVEIPPFFI
jgi:hypothetical protein